MNINSDIRNVMMFRLLFGTQDDRYEPEGAVSVLAAAAELDDEAIAAAFACLGWWAEMEAERRTS